MKLLGWIKKAELQRIRQLNGVSPFLDNKIAKQKAAKAAFANNIHYL